MGRSRSASRSRSSSRSRSRSADRRKPRKEEERKRRSRSRSPKEDRKERRSRSRSRSREKPEITRKERKAVPFGERSQKRRDAEVDKPMVIDETLDDSEIMKLMGLPVGFDTTKQKKVEDGGAHCVRIKTKRQYRQYMNRKGGFDRPLDSNH